MNEAASGGGGEAERGAARPGQGPPGESAELAVVTGAFGYLGSYIARRLLAQGVRVRTLTGHPQRQHELQGRVEALPFHFDDPGRLVDDLRGARAVYNTYWVRFDHGDVTHAGAVANTQNLLRAAREAGVQRFVHVSITKPDARSQLPYFRGKAVMEETLRASGLSYAIVRPTVLFGGRDILLNNIAWLLRRFPWFGLFGDGAYRLQPVHVDDVAELAVRLGASRDDVVVDAVGPETFAYRDLVGLLGRAVGARPRLLRIAPRTALWVAALLRPILGDVLVTRDEIDGLRAERLVSEAPPTCPTRLSEWVRAHGDELGRRYASELGRHYNAAA